jgi:hypothetical protein
MVQNILISCDAVLETGSENFGVITGNVTFKNGSANSGTVNGNAVFEGNSENKAGATVNGNATFAIAARNNGTVTGTITEPDFTLSPAEGQPSYDQVVMSSSTSIRQYQGGGYYNGRYAAYGLAFLTLADAEAFVTWITANVGVNQYEPNGVWSYNGGTYFSQQAAEEAAYQTWLAANTGVNQYATTYVNIGSKDGQWAYNSTEYGSQAAAQAAEDEVNYQAWLAANAGVNEYTGAGSRNGQWAYNQTEYASQALAQAAYVESLPEYDSGTIYNAGDRVKLNGSAYQFNNQPEYSSDVPGTNLSWTLIS